MNDIVLAILATVIAPAITGIVTYMVTRRKDRADAGKTDAEQNGIKADTAGKYRTLLNDEIERRRVAEKNSDEYEDACKELSDENYQLKEENRMLKEQLRKAGLHPVTRPRDGAIGGGG